MPGRLVGKIVAIPRQQVVALRAELTVPPLLATPAFKFRLGFSGGAQQLYLDGMYAASPTKFVGRARFDAPSEEVFPAVDEDGGVRDDIDRVGWAEELGGEIAGHAHGEVVDCKMYFCHDCCWCLSSERSENQKTDEMDILVTPN